MVLECAIGCMSITSILLDTTLVELFDGKFQICYYFWSFSSITFSLTAFSGCGMAFYRLLAVRFHRLIRDQAVKVMLIILTGQHLLLAFYLIIYMNGAKLRGKIRPLF